MEDVIFAGTAGRPPLGRAEVTLTIDNTDGALPIDYTEVSITRRMFRDGAQRVRDQRRRRAGCSTSRSCCRDSGIGREMHVIVGQGQLDAVLHGRPEDRRGFIEEAAGVLKHRKRKEKALRKLDAMQANLDPAAPTSPPSCAASSSRWAGRPRSPAGPPACRPTCATPGCGCSPTTWSTLRDALRPGGRRRDGARGPAAHAVERDAGRGAGSARPSSRRHRAPTRRGWPRAQETWYRLSALAERFRGTAPLAAERRRHLSARRGRTRRRPRPRRSWRPRRPRSATRRRSCATALDADREPAGRRRRRAAASCERRAGRGRAGAGRRRPRASPTGARGWPGWPARSSAARSRLAAGRHEIDRLAAAAGRGRASGPTAAAGRVRRRCRPRSARWTRASVGLDDAHEDAVAALRRGRGAGRRAGRGRAGGRARPRHLAGPPRRARARA